MNTTARKSLVTLTAALISLGLSSGAFAGQRYLVVLKNNQSFKAAHKTFVSQGKYNFKSFSLRTDVGSLGTVNATVENSLENLNTLVVNAEDSEVAKIAQMADVAIVEKEVFHPLPRPFRGGVKISGVTDFSPANVPVGTPWGIKAVKAPEAWAASNKGDGSRVLVLDTGIDKEHPSLKANFEKGQDFTGNSDGSDLTDTVGHGTHVSGTIAGVEDASGFSGVAPAAKLLMGRVCASEGCSNVAVAEGINWGITEKVDVISMSLGGMWSTPGERSAVAAADAAGVTVVAASGNDGSGKVSYPAALPTVIAVGAVNEQLVKADFSQWGPELAVVAPGVAVISSVPMGTGRESEVTVTYDGHTDKVVSTTFQGAKEMEKAVSVELVDCGLGKPEDFAKVNVEGKYALVQRGEIAFGDKAKNAITAKAAGVVVYNNAPGLIHGALTQDGSVLPVPVALVEQTVGEALKTSLVAGKGAQASIVTLRTDYSAFDGTSMATPHVSGVVALIKAANRALTPAQVKAILQKTAQTLSPNTNNEYGAGMVNAEAAVKAAKGL
jgi:serine protease